MNTKRILPAALAALVLAGVAGASAYAKEGREDSRDAAALSSIKITLQQAIATAEQQANGRAVSADIEHDKNVTLIEVEVAGPQGVKTVSVDAQSSQVTANRAGNTDDEDND